MSAGQALLLLAGVAGVAAVVLLTAGWLRHRRPARAESGPGPGRVRQLRARAGSDPVIASLGLDRPAKPSPADPVPRREDDG